MSTTKFVHKATRTGRSLSKCIELEKQKHGANHVEVTTKTKKAKQRECVSNYFNDNALALTGSLSIKLNHSLVHMFCPAVKEEVNSSSSPLCYWASRTKSMAQCVHYNKHNVTI